ncbi:MAG: peptide ABC transporter substrate-binding protein [Alphaproteobacteria bacterium HGW-Alphaproteobacteria-5]|nr:MAG: peptide ABC transporter substrate-binding protein [Alphaproteobacteria bacterium HGW-Alphaproteobacteria-5]
MMKNSLIMSTALLFAAASAMAQDGHVTFTEHVGIQANWEMYSDDSYTASRAGCYEGLTRVSHELTVDPWLATAWSRIDPTTWEFQVREGVTFQDGVPLDAEAVANALTQLLNAPVPARAFSPQAIASVEAVGPMTVAIKTVEPLVTLPGRLAAPAAAILSPAAYGGRGINPVGTCTGPFEITEFDATQSVTLKRFDGYWGGPAKLAGGQVRFIPDANTRSAMLRTGEVQIALRVPTEAVSQIAAIDGLEVAEANAPRIVELLLNNARAPFNDINVRQAVKYAIDTAAISAAVYEGASPPAGGPFRSGEPWAAADSPAVERNLDRARELLATSGVDPASLNLEILGITTRTEQRDIAQIIQAMLSDIGITVSVRIADYGSIEADLISGNYDMALMSRGYVTDLPEPIGFLTADYTCGGSFNISQYCDPEFDAKLAVAAAEEDPVARYRSYAELAQHVYDEAITVFLVNETVFDATSSRVIGYRPHPSNYYVLGADLDFQ